MDRVSRHVRSRNMAAIKSTGMKPEMTVRRLVHRMGYRYRLHRHDLPGRPDMVFPGRHKIIQINGCFWHQHEAPSCKIAHVPRSNSDYWKPKLERTKKRDRDNIANLNELGWKVLVVWECQVKDQDAISSQIEQFLNGRNQIGS